ncbi:MULTISPECIES: MazG nucleotide pyrophosphohydrolase domain-containing protein [Bacillus]|uniref:MazG nucleotide pyrophosphohydrolase domain-containing protein n=1 Tax=Bacillus TaxID=1386 RepID=UPI00094512B5|nr:MULTISPECIES: MazG nucleotide pyrophosphohydrolase domain-containing protein [Bacillus cereus group]MDA1532520.1 pyrophosphatase [Bacillus cereus group sp. TH254-2LC]MEC2918000.1 MazG nucleotide pyrophosphohydrolase domain-containing protein [Bacillus tropicus]MEC2924603.1 MazG nucleotide pyrophosphohydrolase domain-containing protein [Bacillus tropicus]MEC2953616.1 MazG nucleotide pyrophosphohydrolase domain-containing protein [Bacillus tropicus]MEC3047006.1 MazG nucleotide pyrophosphohydr
MNIVEFQRYVSNFSKEKGFQDTTIEERAMYAMAELGELAEVILKRDKIQDSKREIGLEMFDVIWNVCDLANKLEIDLEKAFKEKMMMNKKRQW